MVFQGQEIDDGIEMRQSVFRAFLSTEEHTARVSLFACNLEEAPRFCDDDGVENIGRIIVTFLDSDIARAKKRWSGQHRCHLHKMDYTLVMQPLEGEILCKAEIDGVEKGRTRIEYY